MLHLYTPYHNAGAELAAHGMLRALAARGHQVDVLLSRDHPGISESYVHDGVTVHPRQDKSDPLRWLNDRKPNVIITHLENTDRASILGKQYGVPVVHLLHNTFEPSRAAVAQYHPALAVANTQWMLEDLQDWWQVDQGDRPMPSTLVVHPPVSVAEYATKPGDHITLINLSDDKGSGMFYALAKRFPDRKFLGVVGAYGDQVRLDLPNVEILDHVPGNRMREQVYARTKVLLAPSWYESYGRVAVEAACSGIPVIAHPTPGLREALGGAGIFADREDVDAWEENLRRLLSPRGWSAASKRVKAHAQQIDTAGDLSTFCDRIEEVGRARAS